MSFISKLRGVVSPKKSAGTPSHSVPDAEMQTTAAATAPRQEEITAIPDEEHPEKVRDAVPDPDAQLGVRKIEAVTLAWTKKWLAALLIK